MRWRRILIFVGLSLALHGGLLLWLSRSKPASVSTAPPPAVPEPFWVEIEPEPARPEPSALSPPAERSERPGKRERPFLRKHTGADHRAQSGQPEHTGADHRAQSTRPPSAVAPDQVARPDDVPRKANLAPSFDSIRAGPPTVSSPGGSSIQGPDEKPDPAAVAAVDSMRVKTRVDGFLNDQLAARRVESGVVDGYFGSMRSEMEKAAQNPPAFDPQLLRSFFKSWASAAEAYGRSGTVPTETAAPIESISPLGRAKQDEPGTQLDKLSRTFDQGAALRGLASGQQSALVAVIEIRQSAKGKVQGTLLLQSSGNSAFDAHVIKSAPLAIEGLGEPPEGGAGIHPEGIRSAWSFEGRVVYQKKLRDVDLKKDWWYHALTAPLALVTGSFDETTGDIYTTDFRNPKFVCRVKLLRVY